MVDRAQVGMGSVARHETIFPLHHHAQMLVVQQQDFDGKVFAVAGCQFLDIHLETAVAIDVDDGGVGECHLGTHGRGQSKAHGPEPGTGEPGARGLEFVELGHPHLMLPDPRRDDRLAIVGLLPEFRDGVLLQDAVEFLIVFEGELGLPLLALIDPGGDFQFGAAPRPW